MVASRQYLQDPRLNLSRDTNAVRNTAAFYAVTSSLYVHRRRGSKSRQPRDYTSSLTVAYHPQIYTLRLAEMFEVHKSHPKYKAGMDAKIFNRGGSIPHSREPIGMICVYAFNGRDLAGDCSRTIMHFILRCA